MRIVPRESKKSKIKPNKTLHITGSATIDYSLNQDNSFNSGLLYALSSEGFSITASPLAEIHLFVNHNESKYRETLKLNGGKSLHILLRTEPIPVFPAQYSARVEKKYDLVITIGKPESLNKNNLNFRHPYEYMSNPNLTSTKRHDLQSKLGEIEVENQFQGWSMREYNLTLIAANKVSSRHGENYEKRRVYAKYQASNEIALFGTLWDASLSEKLKHRLRVALHALRNGTIPDVLSLYGKLFTKYKNYHGAPLDKHQVIEKSKYSLVIENSDTYISEKLFDAMIGGSIPIYYGPNLREYGLDDGALVVRHLGSTEELLDKLRTMSEEEAKARLLAISSFLRSEEFQNEWLSEKVYFKIAKSIQSFM